MTDHITSADVFAALGTDSGVTEWTDLYDAPADPHIESDEYAAQLAAVRESTGYVESVRVGEARLVGRRVAVIASEFAFLGGSIGERAARIVAAALRRATSGQLPVVASPVSGGTRMQEGAPAFLQLATIGLAVAEHRAAGLPYLVYLRSPTTGGVMASWASLGHVTLAQPGAFVAFLGPRVVEAITGASIPDGVQRAEHLQRTGVVDRVVPLAELAGVVGDVLEVLAPSAALPDDRQNHPGNTPEAPPEGTRTTPRDGWADVVATRAPGWPDVIALLRATADHVVTLVGPDAAMPDGAAYVALARVGGRGVMAVGFRGAAGSPSVSAADIARVRQAVLDAAELGLGVLAVIDLVGGELSGAAEEAGIAREIARCLAAFVAAQVPTVAVLLGKGTGGAAFAIGATDSVVALEGSWLAPLQPEGASAILYRDVAHAPELARSQGITADALAAAGYVDAVVTDPADVGRAVGNAFERLARLTPDERHAARVARYAALGT